MRIKRFTLSAVQIRCKFLLLAAMVFMLVAPKTHAQTIPLLSESFDQIIFPPAGGWSDSSYSPAAQPANAFPYWYRSTGTSPISIGLPPTLYPANTVAPHSGSGEAWFDSHILDTGTVSELATLPLNLASLSAAGGTYKVSFWVYYQYQGAADTSNIKVYVNPNSPLSTSPGSQLLTTIYPQNNSANFGWIKQIVNIPATFNTYNSAYVIFKATASSQTFDMFLDDVNIDFTPPCTGKPAGHVNHVAPCSGVPFTLSYSDTVFTNLDYKWFASTDSVNWNYGSPISTAYSITQTITTNHYYKIVIHCGISNLYDTVTVNAIVAPFYLCYCSDTSTSNLHNANVGNVTLATFLGHAISLNNGNGLPTTNNASAVHAYSNYTYLTPAIMYKDSLYAEYVTEIASGAFPGGYWAQVYIDFNHNGQFEATERVINKSITNASNPTAVDTFHIPANALYGITGMRVMIENNNTNGPCGVPTLYSNGETEDYLVNIVQDRCNGPANAGTAYISATTMCPGYTFSIADTTHDNNQYGLIYNWQSSPDGGNTWGSLPFVLNQDKLNIVFQHPASYRLMMVCTSSHDTSYSNPVSIAIGPAYACYCVSQAVGNVNDSTDIGAFILGKYVYTKNNVTNNGHINNPSATHGRSDATAGIMDLGIDSTYDFLIYQIMRYANHANAKITLFIDFNNNLTYDIPQDFVLQLKTTADSFFVASRLTIQPHYYTVPNVLTGMRLIINCDTNANAASDFACGTYTSGETVDFVVRLHDSLTAGIGRIPNLSDVLIFPNPTKGKFKVQFNASNYITHLNLHVTNITGQQVMMSSYDNVGIDFSKEIDLSGQPRGIYFIEFMVDGQRMVKKLTID